MQWIKVTGDGISVTHRIEPLVSVWGALDDHRDPGWAGHAGALAALAVRG
ncbi:hypothetical protein AB0M36_23590 [Actinoplanes sp. NPDC051346]